jgi:mRNA interferase HigB
VYRTADQVQVASGRKVIVFNISGNNYRLIAAVHFNTQRAFALRFMTHAEYSKNKWKETL